MIKIINMIFAKLFLAISNNEYPHLRTKILSNIIERYNVKNFVELGVYDGKNVIYLAKKFPNVNFYGVDLWKHFETDRINRLPLNSQKEWDILFDKLSKISSELPNLELIRDFSSKSAEKFNDDFFDMIFIDANHDYKYVKEDIASYMPKIKKTGIISGHDYSLAWYGVIKAVNEVFGTDDIDVLEDSVWVVVDPHSKSA